MKEITSFNEMLLHDASLCSCSISFDPLGGRSVEMKFDRDDGGEFSSNKQTIIFKECVYVQMEINCAYAGPEPIDYGIQVPFGQSSEIFGKNIWVAGIDPENVSIYIIKTSTSGSTIWIVAKRCFLL